MKEKNLTHTKILIVVSRFNEAITNSLRKSAEKCLVQNGIKSENIDVIEVPGAFEIPIAMKLGLSRKKYTAGLAIGAVIRGATPHFDFVAKESIAGVMRVSLETGTIISMGILTTNTEEQALERTGIKFTNKGWETAQTAIEMIQTLNVVK